MTYDSKYDGVSKRAQRAHLMDMLLSPGRTAFHSTCLGHSVERPFAHLAQGSSISTSSSLSSGGLTLAVREWRNSRCSSRKAGVRQVTPTLLVRDPQPTNLPIHHTTTQSHSTLSVYSRGRESWRGCRGESSRGKLCQFPEPDPGKDFPIPMSLEYRGSLTWMYSRQQHTFSRCFPFPHTSSTTATIPTVSLRLKVSCRYTAGTESTRS